MSAAGGGGADVMENIQVIVRARPLNKQEKSKGEDIAIEVRPASSEVVVKPTAAHLSLIAGNGPSKGGVPGAAGAGMIPLSAAFENNFSKRFTFDRTFDGNSTQEALFESSVAPIVDEVLRGFSCTLFCYGQTGTGKTFTMEGKKKEDGTLDADGPDAGMIARSVKKVFQSLDNGGSDSHVKISFLELYNERLDDLLASEPSAFMNNEGGAAPLGKASGGGGRLQLGPASSAAADAAADDRDSKLKIVEEKTKSGSTIRVQNLEELPVKSAEDVFVHLSKGIAKRATAETACNAQSSRSHCVFTLTITTREVDAATGEEVIRVGKLNLVDLAGSECVGRSGAKDVRAREAGNINQSLLTLGRVITALVDHLPHIPYRDSKLTRLLQDSLGGRTKTCIIATLSPAQGCVEESLSTLEYANRAKNIKNKPEANTKLEKRALLKDFTAQLATLQAQLMLQQRKDGGLFMSLEEYNGLHTEVKALKYEVEELKGSNAAQDKEIATLKEGIEALQGELEQWRATAEQRARELAEACEQLEATKESLAEEQVSHHESRALIYSRDLHQGKLARQAASMADTLKASVADVALLHGKVTRANAVMAHNKGAISGYVASLSGKLGLLMNEGAAHTSAQVQALEGVAACLMSVQERCARESAGMVGGVRKLQGDLAAYTKAVSQASAGVDGEVSRQCGLASDGSAARLAAIKEQQLVALAQSVEAALSTMQGMLASHRELLDSWSSTAAASLSDCRASLESYSNEQAEALKALRKGVEEREAETQAALYHQRQALQQLQKERNEATAKATEGLIAMMTGALRQFATDSQRETDEGFAGVMAKVQDTSKASRQASLAAGAGIGASLTRLEQFSSQLGSSIDNAASHNQQFAGKAAAGQEEVVSFAADALGTQVPTSVASIGASIAKASDASAHDWSAVKGAVAAYATRAQVAATSTSERLSKACDTLASQGEQLSGGVATGVTSAVELVRGDVIARERRLYSATSSADGDDDANNEGSVIRGWVGEVAALTAATFTGAANGTGVRELAPTGTTPAKRDYQAPDVASLVTFNEATTGKQVARGFRQAVAEATAASTDGEDAAPSSVEAASALFASPTKARLSTIAAVPSTPAAVTVSTATAAAAVRNAGAGAVALQVSREATLALQQVLREAKATTTIIPSRVASASSSPVTAAPAVATVSPVVALSLNDVKDEEEDEEEAAPAAVSPSYSSVNAPSAQVTPTANSTITAATAPRQKHEAVPANDNDDEDEDEEEADDGRSVASAATASTTASSVVVADAGISALAGVYFDINAAPMQPQGRKQEAAAPAAATLGGARRTRQIAAVATGAPSAPVPSLTKSGRLASASSFSSISSTGSASSPATTAAAPAPVAAQAPGSAAPPVAAVAGRPRRVLGMPLTVAAPAPSASASASIGPANAAAAGAPAPAALKLRASITNKDGTKISLGIGKASAAAANAGATATAGGAAPAAVGTGENAAAVAAPAVAFKSTAVRVTSASAPLSMTGTLGRGVAGKPSVSSEQ